MNKSFDLFICFWLEFCYIYGMILRTNLTDTTWLSMIGDVAAVAPIFSHPDSRFNGTSARKVSP